MTSAGFRCARGELWAPGIPPPSRQPSTDRAWDTVPAGTGSGEPHRPAGYRTDWEARRQFSEIRAENTSQARPGPGAERSPAAPLLSCWLPGTPRGTRDHREPRGPRLNTCLAPTKAALVFHKTRATSLTGETILSLRTREEQSLEEQRRVFTAKEERIQTFSKLQV